MNVLGEIGHTVGAGVDGLQIAKKRIAGPKGTQVHAGGSFVNITAFVSGIHSRDCLKRPPSSRRYPRQSGQRLLLSLRDSLNVELQSPSAHPQGVAGSGCLCGHKKILCFSNHDRNCCLATHRRGRRRQPRCFQPGQLFPHILDGSQLVLEPNISSKPGSPATSWWPEGSSCTSPWPVPDTPSIATIEALCVRNCNGANPTLSIGQLNVASHMSVGRTGGIYVI